MTAPLSSAKIHWVERALDGVDALRDSISSGLAISVQIRKDAEQGDEQALNYAADIVLAFADYFENNLSRAEQTFQKIHAYFQTQDDLCGLVFVRTGYAILWRKLGKAKEAYQLCHEDVIPYLEILPPRLQVLALNIYAIILQELDETEHSIRYFFRALEEARKINSPSRIAQVTANLAEVLYVTGNVDEAEGMLQVACDAADLATEKWLVPFNFTLLALCKIALGKHAEAYQVIAPYIESEDGEDRHANSYRSFYLSVAAYTLALRGNLDEAVRFSESAIAQMDRLEDPHLLPYIWWVSGYLHRCLGQYEEAIEKLSLAISKVGESGYIHLPLRAINELSEIYAELGDWQKAYEEQRRYQVLFARAHERSNKIKLETIKIRNEYKEAEKDRRLTEQMNIERKSLDDELQRMLSERETILENSIVGMIFLNSQGRVQWVNTPLCQIFGVERQNVLGASLEPFYDSRESYLASGAAVGQAVLRGEAYETELQMRRSDGSMFWVQFSGRAVNKKDLSYGTVWVVMDISARRQLEDDLHKSEHNYRLLINNVTEGILVVQNGCIVFANRLIQNLTGLSNEELISLPFTKSIYHEDVAVVADRHQRRLRGEVVQQYYQIRVVNQQTKELVWVEISAVLIEWEGQPATLTFVADLTQRKLLEAQLKESMDEQMRLQTLQMQNELKVSELARRHAEETTEAKSLFLANMSHEIRTPMNAIIGMAHLALKTELSIKQKDYVEKIHKAGMSLMGIINDILDFSKIEAGKLDLEEVEFDLDEVFNSVAVVTSEKAETKGLEYLFDVKSNIPRRLKGDPLRLGQVLINLVNNAIKFTDVGEVCVQCELIDRVDNHVDLKFEVRDTGVGMSATQSSKLFLPFSQGDESTTRKFGGTGLGLSISKGMVDLMDGQISLDSELNVGTCVTFTLPFKFVDTHEHRVNSELFKDLRVLIVDDHPFASRLLQEKMQSYGISCELANSGEKAIALIFEKERHHYFDALFIDFHMPYMDGAELISYIRQNPNLPILPKIALVGANARESVRGIDEIIVPDVYLDKPFNSSNVFDCLVNMFSQQSHPSLMHQLGPHFKCNNLHVLLVEDNAINQQIATELLELVGIQVDVASNGQLAVDRLREMGPEFYRLVFMDVQMPEMDGHEATRLIRGDSRFSQLPIVAMTAHALLIERERCLSSGMNDHIAKPINPVELYQIVEKWCASSIEYIENLVDENPVVTTEELFEIAGIDVRQGLSRTMWDKQLYFKLLRLFVNEQKDVIERINACIENDDWRTAERVAHTFKGVASLIGADLHILAETIELAIKQTQDTELIKSLLKQCGQQLADLVMAILERLGLENALHDFEGRTQDGALLSSDVVLSKLRRCYKLVENYDGESLEALQDSVDELSIAFGTDVQKQIMRAANQYDFDVILSIMKGNARMCGIDLE